MALKPIFMPAALIVLGLQASAAIAQNDLNGPRSDQSQGNSAIVKRATTSGLGQLRSPLAERDFGRALDARRLVRPC